MHDDDLTRRDGRAIRTHRPGLTRGPGLSRAAAALPLVLALGLAGCGGAVRDDTGEVTEAGQADAFNLVLGDCLDEPSLAADAEEGTEVSDVRVVPCSEAHDTEVFALFDLADGDYPGDDAVTVQADEGCYAAFADFVGLSYEESELDYYYLTPTEGSWNELDDREVACLIALPGEQVTGTLEASQR